jgi:tetratricopeptide (TPR) repeat protein
MQGQSLLRIAKTGTDQPAYARSDLPGQGFGWSVLESWRAGKYLYIRAPQPELYDLAADPNATHNLAQSLHATLETMAAQLEAFDNHLAGKSTVSGLTSSEIDKLASLGYVGLEKTGAGANPATQGTDPKDVIARANRVLNGLLAVRDGKPEQAVPAFSDALAGQPDLYLAQYGVGAALVEEQRYSEAIEHLRKAIQLQPNSAWAHYQMGLCLLNTADFKTAAIHLEIVSSRLTESAAVHSMLAEAYEHLGRGQDARREQAKAAELAAQP